MRLLHNYHSPRLPHFHLEGTTTSLGTLLPPLNPLLHRQSISQTYHITTQFLPFSIYSRFVQHQKKMVGKTYKSAPASRSGGRKADLPMRATEPKVKLKIKATKGSRNTALGNSAHMFPFGVPRPTPAQENAVSGTKDLNVRRGSREKFQKKAPDMVYGSDPDYIHGSTVSTTTHLEVPRNSLASPARKSDTCCPGNLHN
jgi:hypothetical protein